MKSFYKASNEYPLHDRDTIEMSGHKHIASTTSSIQG